MLKPFPVIILLITSCHSLSGQYYFYNDKYYNSAIIIEAGIFLVAYNCLTDLGGNKGPGGKFLKDLNLQKIHPGWGVYASVLFQKVLILQVEGNFGKVSAADRVLENDQSAARFRYQRNLHFRSNITELLMKIGWFPRSLLQEDPLFSPYITAGVGVFHFNPRAEFEGTWFALQRLRTEGQGFNQYPHRQPYSLTQFNFPVGIGARYELSAICVARLEFLYRILKTDYLDDVSTTYIDPVFFESNLSRTDALIAGALSDRTGELLPGTRMQAGEIRGNPRNRDAYFSLSIGLSVVLNRKRR